MGEGFSYATVFVLLNASANVFRLDVQILWEQQCCD